MARTTHDPLAGRIDRPDYVPDADIRNTTRKDKRREGTLGGLLLLIIPLVILAAGFLMWSFNLGERGEPGPAIDPAPVVAPSVPADGAAPVVTPTIPSD